MLEREEWPGVPGGLQERTHAKRLCSAREMLKPQQLFGGLFAAARTHPSVP